MPQDNSRTPPARSAYRWWTTLTTRWKDNDIYGHLNNVVYYEFFDTAVNAMLIAKGLLDPVDSPAIGLVVETGCAYAAPLHFPQDITAGLRVAHLGRSSVRYEIALFGPDSATAAAWGHFVHVYVDRETRRSTPLPTSVRTVLKELAEAGDVAGC